MNRGTYLFMVEKIAKAKNRHLQPPTTGKRRRVAGEGRSRGFRRRAYHFTGRHAAARVCP
jgi:hypothetical protein